jgi:hypothetical protein
VPQRSTVHVVLCIEGGRSSISDTECGPRIFSKLNFLPAVWIRLQSRLRAIERHGKSREAAKKGKGDGFMIWYRDTRRGRIEGFCGGGRMLDE